MDKLQWFKFSYADWRMGKIQRCPEVTQARFINLCCLYWSKEGNLSIEDAEIEIDKDHLDILISKKIVEKNKKNISIKFLDEQLVGITETSKDRSKAANIRWQRYRESKDAMQNNASAMQVHKGAMQNDAEERREEERREDNNIIDWNNLLKFFNDLTGKKTKLINDKSKKQINARLKDGYSKKDLMTAIKNCYNDDYHKETNHKYLTLEFISRPDKFDKYVNISETNNLRPLDKLVAYAATKNPLQMESLLKLGYTKQMIEDACK